MGLAPPRLSRYHPSTLPVPLPEASDSTRDLPAQAALAASSSRLIADGDSVARNAFRVGLREDTPLPISASFERAAAGTAGTTRELDPNDILEVQDMAAAIARAEMLLASPTPPRSSRPDMFESLGRRATDDTSGPATPAPPYASLPTPIPPALVAKPIPTPTPIPSTPRYVTMPSPSPPITGAEDDAFYHPVGRMRSLADVTLDGYRPEPTLLVRAATRRKRFSWIMVAVLLPLMVLAAIAMFASADGVSTPPSVAGTTLSQAPRSPATATAGKTPLATTSAVSKALGISAASAASAAEGASNARMPASGPPVFDVNSLPPARARR